MKAVDEPMIAVIHIQNTAPAPPTETAATTPTMLPMPTRVAVDTTSACQPLSAPFSRRGLRSTATRSISGKQRTGRKRVRMVKNTPAGISSSTSSEMPTLEPPGSGRVIRSPHSSA